MKIKKDGTPSRQGQGGGKPPKHDEESIQAAALGYFASCKEDKRFPTKSGVCLALGVDRVTYNKYRKKYPHTIKTIDDNIEEAWVQRLTHQAPTGAIFYLKNAFKEIYRDTHDVTSLGEKLPQPIMNLGHVVQRNNSNKEDKSAHKED